VSLLKGTVLKECCMNRYKATYFCIIN
jgi:hypothetical protein